VSEDPRSGELGGVSPVDGRLSMASSHLSRRVSSSTPLKAAG
jgi:hypothetical protein